jgi:ABC-2 type transport system ATP-binding protein
LASIKVNSLAKTYTVPERDAGLGADLKSLIHRKTRDVKAVDEISFSVESGEIVGFLGPNGAGKTTTLKMLSGHLYPTDGHLEVLGHTPSRRERKFLSRITLVMGQRNQLIWDIPVHGLARTQPGRIPDPTHRLQIDPG